MAIDGGVFEAKVDPSGEHHLWIGATTKQGAGLVRDAGTLRTATQVAWELEHGDIPDGFRVQSCAESRACVRVEHLSLTKYTRRKSVAGNSKRAERGAGSIREVSEGRWKLTIDVDRDQHNRRRRITRVVMGTKADASRALAALSVEAQSGERVPAQHGSALTVTELVHWYIGFARDVRGLERTTVFGYEEVFEIWLQPRIGHILADRLTPAQIDEAFGRMRAEGK